ELWPESIILQLRLTRETTTELHLSLVLNIKMEWRQQSSVSCEDAFTEAQRWIEVGPFTSHVDSFTAQT
ncbi:hypothetical protein ATANTOWER_012167, partial [Ataeniobius toweri]|nr:hypothetical protein [Ataeniobius toweri]